MRKKDKEITDMDEIEKVISGAKIGIVGLSENGTAYTVPVNFVYLKGAIYFHSSSEGRKIDILKKNNSVSFLTFIEGPIVATKPPCNLTQAYKCVMAEGRASFVGGASQKKAVLIALNEKYYPHKEYLSMEEDFIKNFKTKTGSGVEVIKITIDKMTGKSNAWK